MRLASIVTMLLIPATLLAKPYVSPIRHDIKVDGQNNEWSKPLAFYDKSSKISYEVANNNTHLFLIIQVGDSAIREQLLKYGFEVWVNMDGKKKKTTGIFYPLLNHETAELTLKGFLVENGKIPVSDSPVKAALTIDSKGILTYELAIPFTTYYKESLADEIQPPKVQIGFVVKAAQVSDNAQMMFCHAKRYGANGCIWSDLLWLGTQRMVSCLITIEHVTGFRLSFHEK
jgi:hypothetical protein